MNNSRRIFILAGGASWEGQLLTHIEQLPDVMLVRRCIDVSDLLAASKTDQAEIALVDPTVPGLDLDVVDRLLHAGVEIWTVGDGGDHLGVELNIPSNDLLSIGERLRTARVSLPDDFGRHVLSELQDMTADNRGRVTAVWGPTGGPGRSTVAVALAASHARSGESTLLIDADTTGASIAQMFAILDDVSGIMAACRDVNLGRNRRVDEHLLQVIPKLDVLTGIPRPDLWHHIRPAALARVIDRARSTHQQVVVDCGFGIELEEPLAPTQGDITRSVIELADLTVLLGRPDPVGIARMLRSAEDIKDLAAEIALVFNGIRPSTPWAKTEIADMVFQVTHQRPISFLPFDAEVCDRALLRGEAVTEVASESALAKELRQLADMIRSTLGSVSAAAR